MGHPSTLYRFRISLSDVDRSMYEPLDFRAAMHPSEVSDYLLTRVLAYALNFQPGLEFAPGGLSNPDEPGISVSSPNGGYDLWIEIGNVSPRKLHKAAKASRVLKVYTYKDAAHLIREISANQVHRAGEIEIYSFPQEFLSRLAATLKRDNEWSLTHTEGSLILDANGETLQAEVSGHRVPGPDRR
jgi:uncharacterized protein YaeQ